MSECSKCDDTGIIKVNVGGGKFPVYCDCPAGTQKKMVDNEMGVPG